MTNNGDWRGLYGEGWNSEIVPEAFSHPAKFSRALIRQIYKHAVENGWLQPGDCVADPFGGVALGALDAMRQGLNWVGVELEARFVDLGNKNIELWNERYGKHFPGWGSAQLVQGDSRELLGVIAGVDCAISSPPFIDSIGNDKRVGKAADYTGHRLEYYGSTPGNLGNLPAGEIDGVVSSPPYVNQQIAKNSSGIDIEKQWQTYRKSGGGMSLEAFRAQQERHSHEYSDNPQNLGNLPAGEIDGVVSSPPWLATEGGCKPINDDVALMARHAAGNMNIGFGETQGQLTNEPDTFWEAARVIVDQTYAALKPGGVAIWVTKAFVKNKQRVDFPGQWRRMCEAAGFVTVCEHKAWLVEDRGAQYDLFGELVEKTVERKSFFRRLAEKKGSPRIDWETVTCMRKPGATGDGVDGVVSSPPYAESIKDGGKGGIDWGKQADITHGWNYPTAPPSTQTGR